MSSAIDASGRAGDPIRLVASIESARALWNLGDIVNWASVHGNSGGQLAALLVWSLVALVCLFQSLTSAVYVYSSQLKIVNMHIPHRGIYLT